ncbi:MAG: GGDEF domain-containing protein [Steroidobacteraceae bacterium]|jgi:diguanylate cyclase (GGDEF)-like protein|nr:GGDEF domain-containing protein [Steroidobacteraceae bacterium]
MPLPTAKPPPAVRDRRRAEQHSGDEHDSFLRSVTLVDWLVLLLVVLYLLVSREPPPSLALTAGAIVGFAGFLLAFRSKRFPLRSPARRIALDVFVTVVFLTVVVTQAGGADSPLVNLYLLPLVLSAVTLRTRVTVLAFLLVAAAVLLLHLAGPAGRHGPQVVVAHILGELGPFGLVTYLTHRLAGSILLARRRIQDLAERDPLTGLVNLRSMDELVAREHASRSAAGRGTWSVLVADLDRLKAINDGFGHEAGNAALRNAAAAIQRAIRATDTASRYGGDEFVVFLPDASPEVAEAVAQRIRNATFQSLFLAGERMQRMSISVGVGSYPRDGRTVSDVMAAADKRMYQDKTLRRRPGDPPPLRAV